MALQSGSDEAIERALELPHDVRAELAEMLLSSLDEERSGERAQLDLIWAAEIARRRAAVRAGHADDVSWDAVYAELKARRAR